MKRFVEDYVAQELESEGYIVIRTYRKGCPDVIAFPSSIASQVIVREVKAQFDKKTRIQRESIERLQALGVDAQFDFVEQRIGPVDRIRRNRLEQQAERSGWEAYWMELGRQAALQGQPGEAWQQHYRKLRETMCTKDSWKWQAAKVSWEYGWGRESLKMRGDSKP